MDLPPEAIDPKEFNCFWGGGGGVPTSISKET